MLLYLDYFNWLFMMKTLSLLLSLSFFTVGRWWHVDMVAMSSIYQTSEIFIRVELNVEVVTRWEKQQGEEVYGRRGLPVPAIQSNLNNYSG